MSEFSRHVVLWSAGYVVVLLILGGIGRRARRDSTFADFYLANRSLGFFVLLLTLFATQYSGNSISAFPGQTYRQGLSYIMSVPFMVGIVAGYLLFAPRLFSLSRQRQFVTPADFLAERFRSPSLHYLATLIFSVTLFNFLLAQLIAMGHAFEGLTDGRIDYTAGVIGGAAVILIYELLGGMRAVAWTDVLQGSLLLIGMLLVALLIGVEIGSPAEVISGIRKVAPSKIAIADYETCAVWLSNFVLLSLGAPLYPQAIQRIYAARRVAELRRALAGMALLPLIGITTVVFIGATGIVLFPSLEATAADQVTFRLLAFLVEANPLTYYPVLVIIMAVLAAIMSTADSCLLSISSIVSKDIVARLRGLDGRRAERLTRLTPLSSITVMTLVALVALLQPSTL